jgi:hypothetical protein
MRTLNQRYVGTGIDPLQQAVVFSKNRFCCEMFQDFLLPIAARGRVAGHPNLLLQK